MTYQPSAATSADLDAVKQDIAKKADATETTNALNQKANASTVGGISTALNSKASQSSLDAVAATVPVPADTMPPAVSDSGATGDDRRMFALRDHTHASSVQAQRVAMTLVNGKATWAYPKAFASGVVPVVETTVETPDGATYQLDAKIVQGSVTNSACQVVVARINNNYSLPGVLTSLLGLLIPILTQATGTVYVHCWARKPTT